MIGMIGIAVGIIIGFILGLCSVMIYVLSEQNNCKNCKNEKQK